MEIPNNVKLGGIVLGAVAFAFLAGYVLFSYFSKDSGDKHPVANTQITNKNAKPTEPDSEGINPTKGSVAGATSDNDGEGISPTQNQNGGMKGGVLGDTDYNGITPVNAPVSKTTITPEMREENAKKKVIGYKEADDGNDDSEVTLIETPSIDEHTDYVEYTYHFQFNSDARDRYKDGFDYNIDAQTCDSSKFFTSSSHDFKGHVDEVDEDVEISVRIKKDYIDDVNDFDDSEYKLDGTQYTVKGDINVPQCED